MAHCCSNSAGVEEAILHWSGRISGHFQCMENVATHIYTRATCIAQSTITMQGMLMLGDLEACPLGTFLKNRYSEIEFGGISGLNYSY